jgi:hypothetical protein
VSWRRDGKNTACGFADICSFFLWYPLFRFISVKICNSQIGWYVLICLKHDQVYAVAQLHPGPWHLSPFFTTIPWHPIPEIVWKDDETPKFDGWSEPFCALKIIKIYIKLAILKMASPFSDAPNRILSKPYLPLVSSLAPHFS